ncbi:hypothetical protein [Embleya sp. NPDC050493]|uniref:hypothetical protein n=1 Tax=Embleya sp. NPDC050493 TaxID=3363989 RepID=UPI003796928B
MSDLYELTLDVLVRGPLSDPEVAELRWHVGLADGALPEPGDRRIVTAFPVVVVDDLGVPTVVDDPHPVLGGPDGIALRSGGVSATGLAPTAGGWALTVRRELHPDEFDEVGGLLAWLAARVADAHTDPDGSIVLGWLRFVEDTEARPLVFRDGCVRWPDREAG